LVLDIESAEYVDNGHLEGGDAYEHVEGQFAVDGLLAEDVEEVEAVWEKDLVGTLDALTELNDFHELFPVVEPVDVEAVEEVVDRGWSLDGQLVDLLNLVVDVQDAVATEFVGGQWSGQLVQGGQWVETDLFDETVKTLLGTG